MINKYSITSNCGVIDSICHKMLSYVLRVRSQRAYFMGSNRVIFPHIKQLELNLRIIKYLIMRTFYHILISLFLLISVRVFSQPLVPIDSLQWVSPSELSLGGTFSRYKDQTVKVRGVVMLNPRNHALTASWKATYLAQPGISITSEWKGLYVRLSNLADSSAVGFFSNFIPGNIVECTGIVREYQDASLNSGETYLDLLPIMSTVIGTSAGIPTVLPLPMVSFMKRNPTNPLVPMEIQKNIGEAYEGTYVQFNNVLAINMSTFSGGRVSWMLRDSSLSEINVRDAIRFFRPPFVSSSVSVPPNPGVPVYLQNNKVYSHVRGIITETNFMTLYPRYELIPLTPSDVGQVIASPPYIQSLNYPLGLFSTNQPITIRSRVMDLDGSVNSVKLFVSTTPFGQVFDSIPMNLVAPDSFSYTFPNFQRGNNIRFFIKAIDNESNYRIHPDTSNLFGYLNSFRDTSISISTSYSCLGDTTEVTISHRTLSGVAGASLRMTYNPDSLTYVGFNSLNPAFSGMAINGTNGVITMDWNTSTNQTIAAGNMVNLRFRVNGNSSLTWDTLISTSEFYDSAYNHVPQMFSSGSINNRTISLFWNRNVCQGNSFTLGNQSYITSGTYFSRRFGNGGECDTLITLNLNVLPRQTNPSVAICSNQLYTFNGLLLNTSGVYLDTLVNILGCDSIVQLNLTVNPAYNQNLTLTICAGGSLQFGSQNLTVSGNYTNTFVSSGGCDSLVNLGLSVSPTINIVSSNGQNGFCPNSSVRIGLANRIHNVTYQWTKDGSIMTGANSDSLLVTQSGVYRLTLHLSTTCSISSNSINISALNCNRITGDLRYDNTNQTPLAGIPVHLKSLLGNIVASDTTDSSGSYDMAGYTNGSYLLDVSINYTYGGVNSTDALQVTRFFTSLVTLSPLRIKVGDVNGSGITNSGDALLINRRITGLITSFSVGDFINNLPSVNALGNPLVANLRALTTGDVNGTYNPQPTAPTLVLDTVYGNGNVGTAVVRFTNTGSGVFERGLCWGTSPNPTVSGNKLVVGSGGNGFTRSFSSIDPNNTQYVRAYARNSNGFYYSPERNFTPSPRCPGTPSVIDIDGNIYYTVQIGNQCWTQSNLKVSKYRNGDTIPTGLSISAWQNTISGAYAIYNNDPVNDGLYGKLYNHFAVTDSRGLCPTGWHVTSDAEWTTLENQLGGQSVAGGALKSTATQPTPGGWNAPNTGATNSTGFTALPGGRRASDGNFNTMASSGYWWSSSVLSGSDAWYRYLYSNLSSINRANANRAHGFSVRCLKNTLPQVNTTSVTNVIPSTALATGEVISEGGQNATRGFCYSDTSNPTISNDTIMNGSGVGVYSGILQNLTPSSTYYLRAYATNSLGTSYGNVMSFTTDSIPGLRCPGTPTVTDIDGNVYSSVQVGNQCWAQSNLKVSKYRNGDTIPIGLSISAWQNTTSGAYAIYNNDPMNDGLYGKLYNHFAVTDSRGLCPTGWHVPSDAEWTTLENHLGGLSVAGGKMKRTAMQPTPGGWHTPNTGATNSSGFTALPGGLRDDSGVFNSRHSYGCWWSSSVSSGSLAWSRLLSYGDNPIFRYNDNRSFGFSVRCIRD